MFAKAVERTRLLAVSGCSSGKTNDLVPAISHAKEKPAILLLHRDRTLIFIFESIRELFANKRVERPKKNFQVKNIGSKLNCNLLQAYYTVLSMLFC